MKKRAMISGCSSGIGEDIALKLAKENWHVIAGVRNQTDLKRLKQHHNITPILLDVTVQEHVTACAEFFSSQQLSLDVLINNAGLASGGPIEGSSISDWQNVFAVNVFGLVNLSKTLLPFLRQSKGRIINVSSVSGLVASPFMAIYAASKFAVEAISDSLRRELKHLDVHVSVIEPGPVKTKIWTKGEEKSNQSKATYNKSVVSAYGEKLDAFEKAIDAAVMNALDVSKTTEVLYHACQSAKPKTRYIVSKRTLMIKLLRILPDKWSDALILSMR